MKSIKILIVIVLVALSSCSENKVYGKFEKNFKENRWQKTAARTYEFEIKQGATNYNMELHFAHIYGYQFATVPITVRIENPDKTIVSKNINLEVVDKNGKDKGDCAGDICDLYETILDNEHLSVGKYKVTISHQFQGEFLPNILGLGIDVTAAFD